MRSLAALTLTALLALTACSTARIANTKLEAGKGNHDPRQIAQENPNNPVILMTFSGGGVRASALAAAVLQEMSTVRYPTGSGQRALTRDIRLISSVSGGSVTAAWFGLRGSAEHPDGNVGELRRRFLERDNMAALIGQLFNPVTWFKLAFTDYSRIHLVEDLFEDRLFEGATMAQLSGAETPFIILNTTDMASGVSFALNARRFDDICSDFAAFPVSRAVAASAAFPIVLTPLTFENYSAECKGALRNREWIDVALKSSATRQINLPLYLDARYTNDLRRGPNAFRTIDYVHFLDGGLADNLGIKSLRAAITSSYDDVKVLRAISEGQIKKLVIVVVNARSDAPSNLPTNKGVPGIFGSLGAVTSVPIDSSTANAELGLSQLLKEIATATVEAGDESRFQDLAIYGITIDFDQLSADTTEGRELRDRVKEIPTSWSISAEQLRDVEHAAELLLTSHGCYRELLADLRATLKPGTRLAEPDCATKIQDGKLFLPEALAP